MEAIQMIIDVLWPMVEANKQFSSFIIMIGAFRLIAKPAMDMYRAYVKWSASTDDDVQLKKFEDSAFYKVGSWALNYIFSVKVGSQVAPVIEPDKVDPIKELVDQKKTQQ